MRTFYRLLVSSTWSFLVGMVVVGAAGAVPAGFNVQGRLTDSTGVNRNGTFSLKFTLFDSVTAGNNLWSRTFASVGVTNGGFQISLADPDDTNRQLASTLSAASLFLEIQVLSGPGISAPESPLVPRQQLLSVPFSFAAGGIVSSGPAVVNVAGAEQMRVTAQGSVGLGTTNPANKLSVAGNVDVSGNVGIGTFSPGARLDVQGGPINAAGGLCLSGNCQTSWPAPPAPPSTSGHVVNFAHNETTQVIPIQYPVMAEGNNIPQFNQGVEVIRVTITPKSASDNLLILVNVPFGSYQKPNTIAALFQCMDSTCSTAVSNNALSMSGRYANDSGHNLAHYIRYYMNAGTTSAITFMVRVGIGTSWSSQEIWVNGDGIGPGIGGGTSFASIDVLEIGS